MADVFISYSKQHSQLTEDLARDLEAEGYTTWWDTSLLPDDVFLPQTIRTEIKAAKAVIVVWAEHSVTSEWVYSEAAEGRGQRKLLQVRDEALDPRLVPMPFTSGNISLVADRAKILAALARLGVTPSGGQATMEQKEAVRYKAEGRIEISAPFLTNLHGRWFLPGAGKTEWFKDLELGPEMVVVPAGKFMMGSPEDEPQRESWQAGTESPQHEVRIPKAFAVGRCAVTRGQFAAFAAATGYDAGTGWRDPGFAQDDSHPIVCASWNDARAYAEWLSKSTGASYRLPSEAEWEYVCPAGTRTQFFWGSSITPEQASYDGSAEPYKGGGKKSEYRKGTVSGKSFEANPWGLYQVHGNVWEWCEDFWHDSYAYKPETLKATGGARAAGGTVFHVLRGGSWSVNPQYLRAACRNIDLPVARSYDIGFRVARTITS
jgi:formylglycine-generating enzyme required for sulfatase activity